MDDSSGVALSSRKAAFDAAPLPAGLPIKPVGVAGWAVILFFTACLITAVIVLTVGSVSRRESVPGILVPSQGAADVASLRPGVVTAVHVQDGQTVAPGDPLVTIALDSAVDRGREVSQLSNDALDVQREALTEGAGARQSIAVGRRRDIQARRSALQAEVATYDSQKALYSSQVDRTRAVAENGRQLREKGFVSAIQLNQWEQAYAQAQLQLADLEQRHIQSLSDLDRLDIEERILNAETARDDSDVQTARAGLIEKQANALGLEEMTLRADRAGRITTLQARVGRVVNTGEVLGTILPLKSGVEAELWVPSRAVGFVKAGGQVRLMYDSFPYQRFGVAYGTVRQTSSAPVNPTDLPVPLETREALFPIKVVLDQQTVQAEGGPRELIPGMRLTADLLLEKRSILAWLFEPLIAARERARERTTLR